MINKGTFTFALSVSVGESLCVVILLVHICIRSICFDFENHALVCFISYRGPMSNMIYIFFFARTFHRFDFSNI